MPHHFREAGRSGGIATAREYGHLYLEQKGKDKFNELVEQLRNHISSPNYDQNKANELSSNIKRNIEKYEKLYKNLRDQAYQKLIEKNGEPKTSEDGEKYSSLCIKIIPVYIKKYNLPSPEEIQTAKKLVLDTQSYSLNKSISQIILSKKLNDYISLLEKSYLIAEYKDEPNKFFLEFLGADLENEKLFIVKLNGFRTYIGKDFHQALNTYYSSISRHLSDKSKNFDPELGVLRDIVISQSRYAMKLLERLGKSDEAKEFNNQSIKFLIQKTHENLEEDAYDIYKKYNYRPSENEKEECHLCVHYSEGFCSLLKLAVKPEFVCDSFQSMLHHELVEEYAERNEEPFETEENKNLLKIFHELIKHTFQEENFQDVEVANNLNNMLEDYISLLYRTDGEHYLNIQEIQDQVENILSSNVVDIKEKMKLKRTTEKLIKKNNNGNSEIKKMDINYQNLDNILKYILEKEATPTKKNMELQTSGENVEIWKQLIDLSNKDKEKIGILEKQILNLNDIVKTRKKTQNIQRNIDGFVTQIEESYE